MRVLVSDNKRRDNGTFDRKHNVWSLDNFDDGYIDGKGRFRVYLPNHPRSSNRMGYVLRAIVAYEAYHNVIIKDNFEVHHKDGNTLNDSNDNLILMTHS